MQASHCVRKKGRSGGAQAGRGQGGEVWSGGVRGAMAGGRGPGGPGEGANFVEGYGLSRPGGNLGFMLWGLGVSSLGLLVQGLLQGVTERNESTKTKLASNKRGNRLELLK